MKKSIMLLLVATLLYGCAFVKEEVPVDEVYDYGVRLQDGRLVQSTFEVKYNKEDLISLLRDEKLSIDDFVSKLRLEAVLKDGGSKLYKYEEDLKFSGFTTYYVLECNTIDNIKDIFIARNKDNLNDMCSLKIDDLDGVSMKVKSGSISKKGLTVVITDTSDRENIYGTYYRIDEYKNGEWVLLPLKGDALFNSIALGVDENNTLELDIDWTTLYGKLSSGKYRIVKETSVKGEGISHYLTAEFKIK